MDIALENEKINKANEFQKEQENFDNFVKELNKIESFEEIVPDYDERCLMVHWSDHVDS